MGNLFFSFFGVLLQLKQGENTYVTSTFNTLVIVLNSNIIFVFHQVSSAAYMTFFILQATTNRELSCLLYSLAPRFPHKFVKHSKKTISLLRHSVYLIPASVSLSLIFSFHKFEVSSCSRPLHFFSLFFFLFCFQP